MSKGNNGSQPGTKSGKFNPLPGLYFLTALILLYIVLYSLDPSRTARAITFDIRILSQVLPVLLLVIFIMGILNYFLNRKIIVRFLGKEAGIKGWLLTAAAGLLSMGPIYAWYPLLKDLKDQGMRCSFLALFMYNRAIKIQMLPLMVYYFGLIFVVVLSFWMLVASVIQAWIVGLLVPDET